MSRLLLLFVVVPAVELVLLIEIGRWIGTLPTLGLIVVTGALGAYLARRQGLGVLRRMRQETAAGRLLAAAVMDGIIIRNRRRAAGDDLGALLPQTRGCFS